MTRPRIHKAAYLYADEYKKGLLGRREFLARATALGVSSAAAYGLIGLAQPKPAHAAATEGGTLRVNMETKALKDPRLWDWTEFANFCSGWLEYLADFNRDGSVTPALLEGWEANEDATEYTLTLRSGIKWNNGDDLTTEDLAHNFTRWADGTVEGNSMATRVAALQNTETNTLRDDAIEVIDDLTMKLKLNGPDIALMAGLSDYPAVVVHRSYAGEDPSDVPIGTGAYLPEENDVGVRQVLVKNPDHTYWREGAYLDRIEFIDFGTDQSAVYAAAEGGEIDLTYRTDGDYVDLFDAAGWERTEVTTANTIAVRFNQASEPYDNRDVRRALQMATDNALLLELGINGLGLEGEDHHVSPVHPEYAELPRREVDAAGAVERLAAAGHADTEFELISIDTEWQKNTCDAVSSQLRDAGINVRRTVLPGATFWNDWLQYPWSATEWGPRPLGIQIMALAYKSGVAWNETAFANAEFDALVDEAMSIADADKRREVMAKIQTIMQDEGVVIQPYWRKVYSHNNGEFAGVDVHPFYQIFIHDIYKKA